MPDLDVWTIDKRDKLDVIGVELPESAEHIWRGKNCLTTMATLLTCHETDTNYEGSLEDENMVLEERHVVNIEKDIEKNGEDSDEGLAEALDLIRIFRDHTENHDDKLLIVGVWI